jgi:hypothetical protein
LKRQDKLAYGDVALGVECALPVVPPRLARVAPWSKRVWLRRRLLSLFRERIRARPHRLASS